MQPAELNLTTKIDGCEHYIFVCLPPSHAVPTFSETATRRFRRGPYMLWFGGGVEVRSGCKGP
jgi:hypothetical protein